MLDRVEFQLADEAQTAVLGERLAPMLLPGRSLLLKGPVGAGKTTLARALIARRIGAGEDIPSPSYTLVQCYETPQGELWHVDLYRLADMSELEELGLEDAARQGSLIVEWPERLGAALPPGSLTVSLSIEGNTRRVALTSGDDVWREFMAAMEGADAT